MKSEPGYELVELIEAEFHKRTRSNIPFTAGANAVVHNGSIPRICFVDRGGGVDFQGAAKTGGASGDIALDATLWDILLWAADPEQCRELYYELIRAMRDVLGGENVALGEYTLDPRVETARSRLLTAEGIRLRVGIAKETSYDCTLVTVEHFATDAAGVLIAQHASET